MELIEQYESSFERFYDLYSNYNSHTNISAIRAKEDVYQKHFLDSLTAIPFILKQYPNFSKGMRVIDIGSGGGFPAVPLAIVFQEEFPDIKITAIDSVGKKTKFIEELKEKLELKNLEVIQARAEKLSLEKEHHHKYDVLLSRAVAYLPDLITNCEAFMHKDSSFIAFKKKDIDQEILEAKSTLDQHNLVITQQYIYDDKQLLIMRKAK